MKYHREYSNTTHHDEIAMILIGQWQDLAAYYEGSDGNAWSYQSGWSNQGNIEAFLRRVTFRKIRGELNEYGEKLFSGFEHARAMKAGELIEQREHLRAVDETSADYASAEHER